MLAYPNAKINIGLRVVSRRPDGYHNLETAFYPIPLTDVLEIKPLSRTEPACRFQFVGAPMGCPESNLIYKVYESLRAEFSLPPLDIYLCKRIPMGAGLGGGSSDAAAMLRLLSETFELGFSADEMERRLAPLGADCPFFVRNRPVFAEGIGNIFSPVELTLKGMNLLLVKPSVDVSTRAAYRFVAPRIPEEELRALLCLPVEAWRGRIVNDFEDSVFMQYPAVAAIKQTLYDMGAVYASMSGSGSSVFGLFRHSKEEAARVFPDCQVYQWWL